MVVTTTLIRAAELAVGTCDFSTSVSTPKRVLEFGDAKDEEERILRLKADDPIAWQDSYMTSLALRRACEEGADDELKDILLSAESGDFVPSVVHKAFTDACTSELNPIIVRILVDYGGLRLQGVPGYNDLIHKICESTTHSNFSSSKRILQILVADCHADINSYYSSQDSDMSGYSPLGIAVKKRNPPLAFELLALGARPNIGHCSGVTPLKIVDTMKHEKDDEVTSILMNLLRSKGGVLERKLTITDDSSGQLYITKKIVRDGVSIYHKTASHTSYRS